MRSYWTFGWRPEITSKPSLPRREGAFGKNARPGERNRAGETSIKSQGAIRTPKTRRAKPKWSWVGPARKQLWDLMLWCKLMSNSGLTRCLHEMQHRASNGDDLSCRRKR